MNVLKQGDPRKIENYKENKDKKTFKCPICGCVWEARFSLNEIYASVYDGKWHSRCPMTNCEGIGDETQNEEDISLVKNPCVECANFDGWATPNKCDYGRNITHPYKETCDRFERRSFEDSF